MFEDERCTAVVPKGRVFVNEDEQCDVMWANKKMYKAKLILWGTKLECESKQDELEDEMERQTDDTGTMPADTGTMPADTDASSNKENLKPTPKKPKQLNAQPKGGGTKTKKKGSKGKVTTKKAVSNDSGDFDNSEHEFSSNSDDNKDTTSRKTIIISTDDNGDGLKGKGVESADPKHFVSGNKNLGCHCEMIQDKVTDMGIKYEKLQKQVNGMQKIISSLFVIGAKATTQQSLGVMPTTTETQLDSWQNILPLSQSSQATSLIVSGSSSGKEISVSSEITSDEGLLSSDEIPSQLSVSNSADVSVPQSQKLPVSNSTEVSIRQQKLLQSNSIDLSLPQCLKKSQVAHNNNGGLLTRLQLMQLYQRSCSRMNFAAKMSATLFDEETRVTHNVAGRGKPKLDPNIIEYIKMQCFDFFPCKSNETMEKEWSECVKAIDEKSRRLKKQKRV